VLSQKEPVCVVLWCLAIAFHINFAEFGQVTTRVVEHTASGV